MHQAEYYKSAKSLQRKVGVGPVEVLGHVGYNKNSQGRLSHTSVVSRVS